MEPSGMDLLGCIIMTPCVYVCFFFSLFLRYTDVYIYMLPHPMLEGSH